MTTAVKPNTASGSGSAPVDAKVGPEPPSEADPVVAESPEDALSPGEADDRPAAFDPLPPELLVVLEPELPVAELPDPDDDVVTASASSSEATFNPAVTSAKVAGAAPRTAISD